MQEYRRWGKQLKENGESFESRELIVEAVDLPRC